MSTQTDCDVLIVGAGPAGSALALALAAQGRDVQLIEARRHPRVKTCAEYASPRIADELARLGVAAGDWQAHAVPLEGMRVIVGADSVPIRYRDRDGNRCAWGLDRSGFDAALAGAAVEHGARLMDRAVFERPLREDGRVVGAELRGSDGQVIIRSRWLIGADGAHSRVAAGAGVTRSVLVPRRLGLIARYEGIPELQRSGEMHVGPGWYVGLAPVPDGQLNVGMALPLPRSGRRQPAHAQFEAAIGGLPAVARRLQGHARLTSIRGAAPIGHRVRRPAGDGWLLIGDAAGFIDPFTGEGIYRAIRSARLAAEALSKPKDDVTASYLAARRGAFAAKDALTWLIQGMLAAPPVLGYAIRRLAARPEMADVLGSALGDCRPATDALAPATLFGMLRP